MKAMIATGSRRVLRNRGWWWGTFVISQKWQRPIRPIMPKACFQHEGRALLRGYHTEIALMMLRRCEPQRACNAHPRIGRCHFCEMPNLRRRLLVRQSSKWAGPHPPAPIGRPCRSCRCPDPAPCRCRWRGFVSLQRGRRRSGWRL